jgi:hypothetical protein
MVSPGRGPAAAAANEDIPRSTSGKVKRHELESRLVEEPI